MWMNGCDRKPRKGNFIHPQGSVRAENPDFQLESWENSAIWQDAKDAGVFLCKRGNNYIKQAFKTIECKIMNRVNIIVFGK